MFFVSFFTFLHHVSLLSLLGFTASHQPTICSFISSGGLQLNLPVSSVSTPVYPAQSFGTFTSLHFTLGSNLLPFRENFRLSSVFKSTRQMTSQSCRNPHSQHSPPHPHPSRFGPVSQLFPIWIMPRSLYPNPLHQDPRQLFPPETWLHAVFVSVYDSVFLSYKLEHFIVDPQGPSSHLAHLYKVKCR